MPIAFKQTIPLMRILVTESCCTALATTGLYNRLDKISPLDLNGSLSSVLPSWKARLLCNRCNLVPRLSVQIGGWKLALLLGHRARPLSDNRLTLPDGRILTLASRRWCLDLILIRIPPSAS